MTVNQEMRVFREWGLLDCDSLDSGRASDYCSHTVGSVGVRAAKANLSQLLRAAQRGESVTITSFGQPVARLVPAAAAQAPLEERLAELGRRGWIVQQPGPRARPRPLRVRTRGLAQRLLAEGRGER